MTIVVAYQETSEGRGALGHALAEARLRHSDLVVLTAPGRPGGEPVTQLPEVTVPPVGGQGDAADGTDIAVQLRTAVRPDHLSDELLDLAGELDPPLRSLDAIHLAAALELGDELEAVVTYDAHMSQAAEALGLPVAAPF